MSEFNVNVKIDAEKATEEFKRARSELRQATKRGILHAGERIVLPTARRLAPVATGRLRDSLIVKATTSSGYLTTNLRGKQARYVGLQEFGGTVKTPITPRKAKALKIGDRYVSKVGSPRHYHGKHFLTRAVEEKQSAIGRAMLDDIMKAFGDLEA